MSSYKFLFGRLMLNFLFLFNCCSTQNSVTLPKNTKIILFRDFTSCVNIKLNHVRSTSLSIISVPLANILQGRCFSSYCGYSSISYSILRISSASAYSFIMFYLYMQITFSLFRWEDTFNRARLHRDVLSLYLGPTTYLYVV